MQLILQRRHHAKVAASPRMAQKRSGLDFVLASSCLPSTVTTCADRKLSHAAPYFSIKRPSPPPSVRPVIPTVGQPPDVVASPKRCVASSRSRTSAPASARAARLPASTSTRFIPERSITKPSSHTPYPTRLWPPLRTASGKFL